jgi:hypothetical protein
MGCARPVGRAFFPLDEELGLLPGTLTPSLQESLVRLGTWMPFGKAAVELKYFTRTDVSRPTVERVTEAAGAAYVSLQTEEVQQIEEELPLAPQGPAKLVLSADGAMVPLVGGEWTEVKTMVVGEVEQINVKGEKVAHMYNLSYFSRLTDSNSFQRLALVETHRRGIETAGQVAAVADGAPWVQTCVDFHRPDAVRILDFPHAAEYVSLIGQAAFGEGSSTAQTWLGQQLHQLKHTGPAPVLSELRRLVKTHPDRPDMKDNLAYLEKRAAHMQYPAFQAAGWPIGSGANESGNKLVVEARLKGSGMHWARTHVDPMLALRNIACSDRWDEAWPQIVLTLCRQDRQRRAQHRQKRRAQCAIQPQPVLKPVPTIPAPQPLAANISSAEPVRPSQPAIEPAQAKPAGPWRPPAHHPWRRMPIGRARFHPSPKRNNAKT